jgi:hypothetical protein
LSARRAAAGGVSQPETGLSAFDLQLLPPQEKLAFHRGYQ